MLTSAYIRNLEETIESGSYILGPTVRKFEDSLASYLGGGYAIGVGSGTGALELAFESLGLTENDEIIIQANAYIACAFGALRSNAKIRIVDCDPNGLFSIANFQAAITSNTKAVLVVHLYGDCCDMDALTDMCNLKDIVVIEDCAQSLGSYWNNKKLGSFGDISCHSFYPTKNLGALGDAGAVVCKNKETAECIRKLRNLGSTEKYIHSLKGTNSRMDSIQAAFLCEKLQYMDQTILDKRVIAKHYTDSGLNHVRNHDDRVFHSYHLYVIKTDKRDVLMNSLATRGIETIIHYPIPFYKSKAFSEFNHLKFENAEALSRTVLSIPIHTSLTSTEQTYIIQTLVDNSELI